MDLSIRQAAYRSQLTALLPTGRAWATESDPALADFIAALALELAHRTTGGSHAIRRIRNIAGMGSYRRAAG